MLYWAIIGRGGGGGGGGGWAISGVEVAGP